MMILDANRLFPADGEARSVAAKLYETVKDLPIISPHGHTDPRWFAFNEPFPNPTALLIQPDHYIFRMLYSMAKRTPTLARSGASSQSTTISSAEPPPVSGSTTPSKMSLASANASAQ